MKQTFTAQNWRRNKRKQPSTVVIDRNIRCYNALPNDSTDGYVIRSVQFEPFLLEKRFTTHVEIVEPWNEPLWYMTHFWKHEVIACYDSTAHRLFRSVSRLFLDVTVAFYIKDLWYVLKADAYLLGCVKWISTWTYIETRVL